MKMIKTDTIQNWKKNVPELHKVALYIPIRDELING